MNSNKWVSACRRSDFLETIVTKSHTDAKEMSGSGWPSFTSDACWRLQIFVESYKMPITPWTYRGRWFRRRRDGRADSLINLICIDISVLFWLPRLFKFSLVTTKYKRGCYNIDLKNKSCRWRVVCFLFVYVRVCVCTFTVDCQEDSNVKIMAQIIMLNCWA